MDGCDSSKMDLLEVSDTKPDTRAYKRRKVIEKTVVKVKVSATASAGNLKNEGLPYDFWSWRKYGQKPIKGSPFPRGYYKCSTSKGCSAKKQVERCRTDASMLIITYTSTHNHPGPPALPVRKLDQNQNTRHTRFTLKTRKQDSVEEEEEEEEEEAKEDQNQPQMMINQMEEDPFEEAKGKGQEENNMLVSVYLDEEPTIACTSDQLMALSSTSKLSEENDFFDELEELPISSAFKRTNLFDEIRIPIVPS